MEPALDLYADVVAIYVSTIRQFSPEAAADMEKITSNFGGRAGLRATLIITVLKLEIQEKRALRDITIQAYLLKDYPEALPLLEHAVVRCLQAWAVPFEEPFHLSLIYQSGPVDGAASPSATVPPRFDD